jgi:hypothetical protein
MFGLQLEIAGELPRVRQDPTLVAQALAFLNISESHDGRFPFPFVLSVSSSHRKVLECGKMMGYVWSRCEESHRPISFTAQLDFPTWVTWTTLNEAHTHRMSDDNPVVLSVLVSSPSHISIKKDAA